jgi:hypothetical protein
MAVRLVGAPFHEGDEGVGMGAGPWALLGGEPGVEWIAPPDPALSPLARIFEIDRRIARAVAAARAAGDVPLALTAFDPAADPSGRAGAAARQLLDRGRRLADQRVDSHLRQQGNPWRHRIRSWRP